MVKLDFQVDPESIVEARRMDLASCDVATLTHQLFLMPVNLSANGNELFNTVTGIFYLAHGALFAIRELPRSDSVLLHPPGMTIMLQMDDEDVQLQIVGAPVSVLLPYVELLQAWESFADQVAAFLSNEFPELRRNAEVGDWLMSRDNQAR